MPPRKLHEIPGRNEFDSPSPDSLGRTGIDTRQIGYGTFGGVFHGDARNAVEQVREAGSNSAPRIDGLVSRQRIEVVPFDRVTRARGRRWTESGSTTGASSYARRW